MKTDLFLKQQNAILQNAIVPDEHLAISYLVSQLSELHWYCLAQTVVSK